MGIRLFHTILRTFTGVWFFLKGLGTRRKWVAVVLGLAIVSGVAYVFLSPQPETDDSLSSDIRSVVELISVSDYGEGGANAPSVIGVESVVRAETSGKVVAVLPVGTRILKGSTLAQFENSAQQASLLQAEGALDATKASLEKTQGGLRSEKIAVLHTAFDTAESGAVTTLLSAYATLDSAVRDTADQMFSNPESANPLLFLASSNNQRRVDAENQRAFLGTVLRRESSASASISTDADLKAELTATEDEIRQARTFIDTVIAVLNEAIATNGVTESDIAAYKASATAARTALTATLSSIASARAALETAEKNLEEGLSGAEHTDLAVASASVKQAQGAYDAALSAYQKTIVRAPVSGTVASCNASLGDVLSVGSDICRIKTASGANVSDTFTLPLSSVKYTPTGAFVFIVSENGTLESIDVTTGLVSAHGITVHGLFGDEFVVRDVRGLKAGETVRIK